MVRITYIEHDGQAVTVAAPVGQSIMKAAANAGVAGIAADCGGNCACGTCRIYVPEEWRDRLPPSAATEREMVDYSGDHTPGVRLSCQIPVTEELDGLTVRLPRNQHY